MSANEPRSGGVFVTDRARPEVPHLDLRPPPPSVAARRWLALLDWAGVETTPLDFPGLYAGPHGLSALRDRSGRDPAKSWRLSITPPAAFEPTPGLWTAATVDWPGAGALFDRGPSCPSRVVAGADLLLAPTDDVAAAYRDAGGPAVATVATPIAPRAEFVDHAERDRDGGFGAAAEALILWAPRGGGLAPGRLADVIARRRGPIFLARIDVATNPASALRLVSLALSLAAPDAPWRLVLTLDLGDAALTSLLAEATLARAVDRAGDGIGLVSEPVDEATWRDLALGASAVVALTSGDATSAADERAWLALAAASGCAVVAPERPPFAEWIAHGAVPSPAARLRIDEAGDDRFVWSADRPGLIDALSRLVEAGPAGAASRLGRRLADQSSFEAVWRVLVDRTPAGVAP